MRRHHPEYIMEICGHEPAKAPLILLVINHIHHFSTGGEVQEGLRQSGATAQHI